MTLFHSRGIKQFAVDVFVQIERSKLVINYNFYQFNKTAIDIEPFITPFFFQIRKAWLAED